MANVLVVLSGCGVNDGAEVQESVVTLLALERAGAEVTFGAPDIDQMHVVNHQLGAPAEGETRNVLVESARIARGPVADLAEVNHDDFDALVFPGGFGAAKNLCSFAVDGPNMMVVSDVARLIGDFVDAGKPVGAWCIAPALLAKVLGERGVKLTIGNDPETAAALEGLGARHENRAVDDICIDSDLKVVTTPAYMLGPGVKEIALGIDKAVQAVLSLA